MQPKELGIKRVVFSNVSGFLVYTESVAMMVDTGYKGMSNKVLTTLEETGHSLESLKLIVLSHSHYDHAGSTAELKKISDASLIVHENIASNLQKGRSSLTDGNMWKGKLMAWVARYFSKRIQKIDCVEPDILVKERLDLSDYGIPGYILHTPGHTSGSVSVILDNGVAIVGDNMLGIQGKEHYPPFADNKNHVLESWVKLIDSGSKVFYPAHGEEIPVEEIINELPEAILKYKV